MLEVVIGRISRPILSWGGGVSTFILTTATGKKTPIIVLDDGLLKKCKQGVDLTIGGARNETE
jgi:hypothetical protein